MIWIIFPGGDLDTSCGGNGWIAYKSEKCFKLIEKHTSRDKSAEVCGQQGLENDLFASTLASINSLDEQDFLIKNILGSSITDHVWIGAKRRGQWR